MLRFLHSKLSSWRFRDTSAGRKFCQRFGIRASKAVHAMGLSDHRPGPPPRFRRARTHIAPPGQHRAHAFISSFGGAVLRQIALRLRAERYGVLLLGQSAHHENSDAGMSGLYVPEDIQPTAIGQMNIEDTKSHSDSRARREVSLPLADLSLQQTTLCYCVLVIIYVENPPAVTKPRRAA